MITFHANVLSSYWLTGRLFIIISCLLVRPAKCDCFSDGQYFANGTTWQASLCTWCTCNDPVPVCENIQCHDPHCDYAMGQHLQVMAKACCPVCGTAGKPCQFQGQSVPDKTSWTPSQCTTCMCSDGQVRCSRAICPPTICKPGQLAQNLPGQCCPRCLPTGRPCTDEEGTRREDGAEWSPLLCVLCVCRDGHSQCLPRQCPTPSCSQDDLIAPVDGQCCPACRGSLCQHQGRILEDKEIWKPDACTTCQCDLGTVYCRKQHCANHSRCQQDEVAVNSHGQCCPQCIHQTGACDVDSINFYHGDLWNISDCEYCMCHQGQVQCRTLICPSLQCEQGQVLTHTSGRCCAECISPLVCQQGDQTFQEGATWDIDACTVCTCRAGETRCYQKTCAQCPEGQTHITGAGDCCGHCQTVECSSACLSCLPQRPSHCTQCREAGKLLQTGQCMDRCQTGFYPGTNNTCLACHSSCQSCIDGTKHHCTACPPSSLLKEGQCVSSCGPAHFQRNGQCFACDTSCSSCSGPGPTQCLRCARESQVLLRGSCLDTCPPRHYLMRQKCMVCPPTCRTCVSDSPACSSCHSPAFLYSGQCLPACPKGYFADTNFLCRECHPSCTACNEGSASSCVECKEGNILHNGHCQQLCPRGYYLAHNNNCLECDEGCRQCYGKSVRDVLLPICTQCVNSSQVTQEAKCTDTCSSGTYLRDGICFGCEEKCKECSGLGLCTRCFQPFVLSKGNCVQSCPGRSFSDETNSCRDCPEHCLSCLNRQVCMSCDSTTYLWRGVCAEKCEMGLVSDPVDRACYENVHSPQVKITGPLLVPYKSAAFLTNSLIEVIDHDTPPKSLTINLLSLPTNGQLLLSSGGREAILGHGDSFLVQNLSQDRLRFVHTDSGHLTGQVAFHVFDGKLTSDIVNLQIRILPPKPLGIRVNKPLNAVKNEITTVTLDTLDFLSLVQDAEVTIHVTDGPRHGYLQNKHNGNIIRSFTLSDLHREDIVYKHHGNSSSSADMVVLLASDGFQQFSIILSISIRLKNSMTPVSVTNRGGQVIAGHKLQISKDLLEVKAMGQSSPEVIYSLVPTEHNPVKGEVMMIVPIPVGGPGNGWKDMGDGTMGAKVLRFLQRDIDEGHIYYKHQGLNSANTDAFTFEVSDISEPHHTLQNQSFFIRVLPEVQDDSSQFSFPTLAAGIHLGMKSLLHQFSLLTSFIGEHSKDLDTLVSLLVLENQVVPITSSVLAFPDLDTNDHDLVYHLTSVLGENEGTIENIDFPFRPVLEFTQQDINNNHIVYRPPDEEIGLVEKEVSFQFVLMNSADDQKLPEQTFTIHILPVNNMPSKFQNPNPHVTVAEGTVVPIPATLLAVLDSDTAPQDLTITVIEEPELGYLEKMDQKSVITLHTGNSFPYTEALTSTFQYTHKGVEGETIDMISLSASDGVFQADTTITVNILKVDSSAPTLLSSASRHITVTEGDTVWIQRAHLAFSDSEDEDKDLMIILSRGLDYGELVVGDPPRTLTVKEFFTQADIDDGLLRYVANSEIGSKAVTELLHFNISDSSHNMLPGQVMTVFITPVDNQPPVISNNKMDLEVNEGGEAKINFVMIGIKDVDTELSDLKINIVVPPALGQLVNKRPVTGSEQAGQDEVKEVSLTDLLEEYLIYEQSDHQQKELESDMFLFTVTDGINTSPLNRFNFTIIPVNDEPPSIMTEQLFVKEGQAVALTNSSMYIIDLDTLPEDLILNIILPPASGIIKRKDFYMDPLLEAKVLRQNDSFTYEDVLQELIFYEHNDNEISTDMLVLHVSDGDYNDTKQLNIIVGLINDETPRLSINRGLLVKAGSSTAITSSHLKAADVDSEDSDIIFTLKRDPTAGRLQYTASDGTTSVLTVKGPHTTFTQADIDKGRIAFIHEVGELTGTLLFKFMLSDLGGNDLIDQDFFITVLQDRFPPSEVSNKELRMKEGERQKITTEVLSFTDKDSEPGSLLYRVFEGPHLGHLEITDMPGVPVLEFTQSDLAAGKVYYVHTSSAEMYMDQFIFSVTDGTNEVVQTFYITLTPVDDAIPLVINNGLITQEGLRKVITEFDLKAIDPDTMEEDIIFKVMQPPVHGVLDLEMNKQHVQALRFSMSDIYENRISYQHSGSEQFVDAFTFTVSDGTNDMFTMQSDQPMGQPHQPLTSPQKFHIDILPRDDGTPVLHTNRGLDFLETSENMAGNYITEHELKTVDEDSQAEDITYVITKLPLHGVVEHTDHQGRQISSFTQEDVNNGLIRYILLSDDGQELQDEFEFIVMDAKPNIVKGNAFHIRWSRISLGSATFNVSETSGILQVPVLRLGNLKQYAVVECRTKAAKAMSEEGSDQLGLFDFVHFSGQVQFDEWQDIKMCTVLINDDSVYEGPETFYVELLSPAYAMLGNIKTASVTILDEEDVPTIQFEQEVVSVNETDVYVMAALKRTGDLGDTLSVICSTSSMTATGSSLTGLETGSDFISRGNSNAFRITFPVGISTATCDVKLLDDSDYESAEQFELHLSEPSVPGVLGPLATSFVIIEGPNDESHVFLSAPDYHFAENAGVVGVEVVREGSDLSHITTVWCATRLSHPPSATPAVDYLPSSSQITFSPGQVAQKCQLTVLDDDHDPRLEGNETFEVFLSSAMGSLLAKPSHSTVVIQDHFLDAPVFTFLQDVYTVDEKNSSVNAVILRLGDLTLSASIICYTRQMTATALLDYEERVYTNQSRVFFGPGDRQKNCTIVIVDDQDFEPDEELQLRLVEPVTEGGVIAQTGNLDVTVVIITNHDDVPKVQLEKSAYSIHEPNVKEQITTVVVHVLRTGADNQTCSVRCSTRDGSAQSGLDYNARSLRITFPPGVKKVDFPVDILYNSNVEWHEAFTVLLGPEDPEGAMFGPVTIATITILDSEVSGSLVLPAAPVVVSLLHYDDVEQGIKVDPSPGYPLICINPCDIHYPTYSVLHTMCEEAGINISAILYQWEVATPPDASGLESPFVLVSDNTLFTSTTDRVLDSVYFRPYFRVRCVAQPLHANGNPGVPLRSSPVIIGRNNGICNPSAFGNDFQGYHTQSFLATLAYVQPDAEQHSNTIHIRVEIPHHDGMLPLVSTFPLHNIRFLLSDPVYRQQHVCSNIITAEERAPFMDEGFLVGLSEEDDLPFGPGYDFPYQFDSELRHKQTLTLYRHLDLKRCMWTFDAYYHMSELVNICGGRVVSDFTIKDHSQTHLTVRVPLHVSYLFAAAPVGWTSLEHRTEMELAFYYNSVLWHSGLETEGRLGGKLEIRRILIGQDGKLVIEFHTQAKFRGLYLKSHRTAPGVESRLLAPKSLAISFDLEHLWSQNTFDSPHQMWRATSRYNLKDYTGMYVIELIPCAVTPTQPYVNIDPLPCNVGHLQRFEVPLSFQQTNRPVPVVYSLDTQFQLTNNLKIFLLDPRTTSMTHDDWNFNGAFSKGQDLYGRVLWSPNQDLKAAYKLTIEKVYLCTGSNGYIPTYDPEGNIYNEGPQYGCIQPSLNLLFRFLILDRENPDAAQSNFQEIPFDAAFASNRQELSPIVEIPGVDGFVFNVDPLYKVDSGHQWYLQVVYLIGPADTPFYRLKRQANAPLQHQGVSSDNNRDPSEKSRWDKVHYGTNMKHIPMDQTSATSSTSFIYLAYTVLPVLVFIVASAAVTTAIVCIRKRRRKHKYSESIIRNNLIQSKPVKGVSVSAVNSLHFPVCNQKLNKMSDKNEYESMAVGPRCNITKAKMSNVLAQLHVNDGTEV